MQRADDVAVVPATQSELEDFLASVEDDDTAERIRRTRRDLVFGLLAIPVLFVGLVAAIVWIVPVVATWLPIAVDYLALMRVG